MATYVEIADLRQNEILKKKVYVAVSKAAMDIRNESEATANHRLRKIWSDRAIQAPEAVGDAMMWAILGNPTIQTSGQDSTDNDVQFVVNSLIDTFAQ